MFFRKSRNTDKYICERKISNLKDVIKQYVDAFLKLDRHEQNIKFLLNRGYTLEYVKINDVIYQMIKQIFKIDKDEDIVVELYLYELNEHLVGLSQGNHIVFSTGIITGDKLVIDELYVNPKYYRQGFGSFIFKRNEDIARFFKCDRITGKVAHNSNMTIEELKKFYCSLGCDCTDFSFSKEIELKNICISI